MSLYWMSILHGNPSGQQHLKSSIPWIVASDPRGTVSIYGWSPDARPHSVCAVQGDGLERWTWVPWSLLTSPGPPVVKGSIPSASSILSLPSWELFLVTFCGSINLDAFLKWDLDLYQWDIAGFITGFLFRYKWALHWEMSHRWKCSLMTIANINEHQLFARQHAKYF